MHAPKSEIIRQTKLAQMSSGQSNFEFKASHKTEVISKSQANPFAFFPAERAVCDIYKSLSYSTNKLAFTNVCKFLIPYSFHQ